VTRRTSRPPGDAPSDGTFAAALGGLALAPRLYVALAWSGEAVWDGHYYDFGARRIAAGFGYSDDLHAWCHYPVGYSAVLGVFYKLFGAGQITAALMNALIGAALALVTWLLAREALTPWRARAAGLLVALHPGLVVYAALVMTEPLAALATFVAFWLAVRDQRPWRGLVLGALALGLGTLVRPQALLCAPFLALVVWRRTGEARRTALAAALACVVTLAPVLPWTARNCRVMDGCALVSTNAGWNLAIGAFPRATGRFETLRASDGCREVTGQVQQDRCWLHYGMEQIRAAPGRWLRLVPAKLGYTFDHESFAVEYLREARPSAWPEARRVRTRALLTLVHRLLVVAAAFGAIALRPRGRPALAQAGLFALAAALTLVAFTASAPTFWPLAVLAALGPFVPLPGRADAAPGLLLAAALLASAVVTHAVFFGEDRYHVVVTPALAMLAAAAFRSSVRAP